MIRIKIHLVYERRLLIVLVSLLLALLVSRWTAKSRGQTIIRPETDPTVAAQNVQRLFYLTSNANTPANNVLNACAAGYHTASLWEILDVSNLSYAYDHPDAMTRADSGNGPPSNVYGWARTGYASATNGGPGRSNCSAWTSNNVNHDGTRIRLPLAWETAPGQIFTWNVDTASCSATLRVWCVGDSSASRIIYLPVILSDS